MNDREKFANDTAVTSTLREIHRLCQSKRFWAAMAIGIIVLVLSGPFDTQNLLNVAERIVYWTLVAITTFFIGVSVNSFVYYWLKSGTLPRLVIRIIGVAIAGTGITLWIWGINKVVFGFPMSDDFEFLRLLAYCTIITGCVLLIYNMVSDLAEGAQTLPNQSKTPTSSFFDRLQKPIGTDLISLKAQDHYLEVTTTLGSDLILMRLADAERELESEDGQRIHRSHWISKKHITGTRRENGQAIITLSNGAEFPVGRSYIKSAREADLI